MQLPPGPACPAVLLAPATRPARTASARCCRSAGATARAGRHAAAARRSRDYAGSRWCGPERRDRARAAGARCRRSPPPGAGRDGRRAAASAPARSPGPSSGPDRPASSAADACHPAIAASSSQSVRSPRRLSPASYCGQFRIRYCARGTRWRRAELCLNGKGRLSGSAGPPAYCAHRSSASLHAPTPPVCLHLLPKIRSIKFKKAYAAL